MKGLYLPSKRHTTQNSRYQEATVSVQKYMGPSRVFIHQTTYTNSTKSEGRGGNNTLSSFLSNRQYNSSAKKAEEKQIHKHILRNLFCLLSAHTLDDMSA